MSDNHDQVDMCHDFLQKTLCPTKRPQKDDSSLLVKFSEFIRAEELAKAASFSHRKSRAPDVHPHLLSGLRTFFSLNLYFRPPTFAFCHSKPLHLTFRLYIRGTDAISEETWVKPGKRKTTPGKVAFSRN